MKLFVVAVGERMPGWVDEAFADYARRMPRRARIELVEIRPAPRHATSSVAQALTAEAKRIHAALPARCRRVALDERGRTLTTMELARNMESWLAGGEDVAFLIGGPDGLAPELKRSAGLAMRLSSFTLPHGLARVVLAEQLYRALSILDHHPYHRE
ncbi:MAG: 23S rRNA (pseudouridine(1915)-N(3))-methyltransferase RlmH [Betaproteobacteria bacterium]|jgi:23S rRNA (pseudouridine1915-N3)-methyltransferase|nr:23S rRNA (pseudouridine(1915)-N(3))-methyltransferase RlmH [Betaproteobacteria bacterium]